MTETHDERFYFRWGVSLLDEMQDHTQVFNFMLRNYARAGVTRPEFLLIIHLSSYHYESARGMAAPSLTTIAEEMGYSSVQAVRNLYQSLEKKGLLSVTRQVGGTNIYDLRGFAAAMLQMRMEELLEQDTPQEILTPQESLTPPPQEILTPPLKNSLPEEEEKEEEKEETTTAAARNDAGDVVDANVFAFEQNLAALEACGVGATDAARLVARRAAVSPAMIRAWAAHVGARGDVDNAPAYLLAVLKTATGGPSNGNGRRSREGVWSAEELAAARALALAEEPVDIEAILGGVDR